MRKEQKEKNFRLLGKIYVPPQHRKQTAGELHHLRQVVEGHGESEDDEYGDDLKVPLAPFSVLRTAVG